MHLDFTLKMDNIKHNIFLDINQILKLSDNK
jgi:hypothetical protein